PTTPAVDTRVGVKLVSATDDILTIRALSSGGHIIGLPYGDLGNAITMSTQGAYVEFQYTSTNTWQMVVDHRNPAYYASVALTASAGATLAPDTYTDGSYTTSVNIDLPSNPAINTRVYFQPYSITGST